MSASPYKPDDLAMARHVVTHAQALTAVTPETRAEIIDLALTILRKDRALRLHQTLTQPIGEGRILRVPLAVFQAGPARVRRRPPSPPNAPHPGHTTPGDAA